MPHQPAARVAAVAAGLVMAALLASDGAAVFGTTVPGSAVDDKPVTGLRLGEVATIRDRFGDVVDVTIGSAQLRTDCVAHGFRILDRQNVYADVTVTAATGTPASWKLGRA